MTPPEIHAITNIRLPKADIRKLPSGMRLCCVRGGDAEVVRLRIVWNRGELDCRLPQVARIATLLMPEGSEHFPDGEAARILDFNGARLTISTTDHCTVLTLTCLTSKLSSVLPVVTDIICHPSLKEQTFSLMREISAMRLATAMMDVDTRASMLINRLMRGKAHPKSAEITPESVRGISYEEVVLYYHHTFRGGNSAIALVSGNFSDKNLQTVEDMLGRLPCETVPEIQLAAFVPDSPGVYTTRVADALQAGIRMGMPVPSAGTPEGVDVRNAISALGGYFGSRLMRNIREDKGYTYGIQAYMLNNPEGPAMHITVQTDISLVNAVIEETRKEMLKLADNPPAGEELERLRQSLALELAAVVDTPFSIADEYMRQLTGLVPDDFFAHREASLSTLSSDIIGATAAKYLNPAALRIAIATKS